MPVPLSAAGRSLCYRCAAWDWAIVQIDDDWLWEHHCKSPLRCTPGDHVSVCRGYAMLALIGMAKTLFNPVALVAALALFAGGLWTGNHLANQAAKADRLDAVERAIVQANEIAREDAEILAAGDVKHAARRVAMKQLDEEIEKNVEANPAYLECGLDADGLRLWNAANAGYDDLPGQRGYGLPAAPLGQVGKPRGAGEKPQGSDRSIPRLQSPVPGSADAIQQPKEQP
ncbi:MAG: hypothetical protein Q8L39_04745 [Burkholderiales bacterium]|nr:hypothetical protein [Burkholderiales bacterium]